MDTLLQIMNGFAYLALGAVATHLCLDRSFDDGILMKLGLVIFALSCGASFGILYDGLSPGEARYLSRAGFGRNLGLLVILAAYWLRHGKADVSIIGRHVRICIDFARSLPGKVKWK